MTLEQLIDQTESMDETEKRYWKDILPHMDEIQVNRLRTILETEKQKLEKLEEEYQKAIKKAKLHR